MHNWQGQNQMQSYDGTRTCVEMLNSPEHGLQSLRVQHTDILEPDQQKTLNTGSEVSANKHGNLPGDTDTHIR